MKAFRSARSSAYLKLIGHIGALITVVAWGVSFLSTKVLMVDAGFTPVEMYEYRFLFAYLLLLALTFRKIMSASAADEWLFLICGVCAGSLYFITENYALKFTTTGNVSLLASISPIFTAILMGVVFKTKIKPAVIIGSVIAFTGVACVILSSGEGFEINPTGDLLAIAAAMSWAVYTILVRRLIPNYTSLFITRKLFFYGVLTGLPLLWMQHEPYHLVLLFDFSNIHYLANMLFLVVVCSCGAYIVWNEAMKLLGPVASNNYLYLQPLVTMVSAYFVLGEQIFLLGYIGCALIIGGLIISDRLENFKFVRR